MALPVTGPQTAILSRSMRGPGSFYLKKSRYKQARPYNLALPYSSFHRYCLRSNLATTSPDNMSASSGNAATGYPANYSAKHVVNYDSSFRAMEKLRGEISERAEWLVNLAERKQAMNMVASRLLTIAKFAHAVATGNLGAMNRLMGVGTSFRAKARGFSGTFLEYHFGWSPMVADIYTGIDILQSPVRPKAVRAYSKVTHNPQYYRSENSNYKTFVTQRLVSSSCVGCSVEVTNPNLYLANQLGLVNPASLVWELVPYSFVLDWFVPVGQFLNSFTEWMGLQITDKYTTTVVIDNIVYGLTPKVPGIPTGFAINEAVSCNRILTLPSASLRPPSPRRLSATRAVTAISLLLQRLKP